MEYLWLGSSSGVLHMVGFSYFCLVGYVVVLSFFIITVVVVVMLCQLLLHVGVSPTESDNNLVEFLWTLFPSVLVVLLSFLNVNNMSGEIVKEIYQGVKVVGRQWYWSYSSPSSDNILYDSVITDFVDGVDKPLLLEWGKSYEFYVTSADVIHSFSVPLLGMKADAVPGRVNSFYISPDCLGSHVGYCSELCGAGHAYMPIVVEVVL